MKILVTGNLGYVGPVAVRHLRSSRADAHIAGFDAGFFSQCLTGVGAIPERLLDVQHFGDVRNVEDDVLRDVDAVVHLAGISNDPIGNRFEQVTLDINHRGTVDIARRAKAAGASRFIFASSCSIYGQADDTARDETSELGPLTAYARSKALAEADLEPLAADGFSVTCLRFATACGMSDRLRLDLVLNDFVAGAITAGRIEILSDGTPWRPLIHVSDMARAIDWAIDRDSGTPSPFLAINVGSNQWNYQVRELADAVAQEVGGTSVSVNPDAPPDRRSYRVSFDQFARLAPNHVPAVSLGDAVSELAEGLRRMNFKDADFRSSQLMRLHVLSRHLDAGLLTDDLAWTG